MESNRSRTIQLTHLCEDQLLPPASCLINVKLYILYLPGTLQLPSKFIADFYFKFAETYMHRTQSSNDWQVHSSVSMSKINEHFGVLWPTHHHGVKYLLHYLLPISCDTDINVYDSILCCFAVYVQHLSSWYMIGIYR